MKTKEEKLATRRAWYEKNKKTERVRLRVSNTRRKEEIRSWLKEYKSSLSCTQCPENHPGCIVFHHQDPSKKEFNLGDAINRGWCKEKVLEEIKKCNVLCSNCHQKLHWNERNKIMSS